MTSIVSTADGQGYLIVDRAGQAFSFGDAPYFGDVASTVPGYSGSVVGIAASARLTAGLGLPDHIGEPGELPEASQGAQQPGVDAMVGGAEQAQIAPTVAVGPQLRLVVASSAQKAVGPEVDDQPGVLLRPPAVLALVVAGQEPAAADGEAGGQDAVDPEQLTGRAHVALRGGRDDDHVVPLALVPLQAQPGVLAEVAGQMALGERDGTLVHQLDGKAAEQAGEELLLGRVGRGASHQRGAEQLGDRATTARKTGQKPRTATRNGRTLPPLVRVPSKSKAATVLAARRCGGERPRHPAPVGWSRAHRRVRQGWRRPARPPRRSGGRPRASPRCRRRPARGGPR